MTREAERLKWQKKFELNRAYGLIKGITYTIKNCEDFNKEGLVKGLEEVEEILKKHMGGKK